MCLPRLMSLLKKSFSLSFIYTIIFMGLAFAEPLQPEDVPEPLKPWTKWVLRDQDEKLCPFLYRNGEVQYCRWPSRLNLELNVAGGQFNQSWLVFADGWVPLPGDARLWPQGVMIDDTQARVIEKNNLPGVYLTKGSHTLNGEFYWDNLPEALTIPADTGIVGLMVNGQNVTFPELDDQGKLWLRKREGKKEQGVDDTISVKVHRRIIDEIPMMIMTQIELNISGRQREILLGKAMTENDIPMSLNSPIPALLDPDGRLRIQARPGQWIVVLQVRRSGPVNSITLEQPDHYWPDEEVWVFDARNHLRMVIVEGLTALDPRQTTLPTEWQGLPAFMVKSGDTMKIVEKKRGDPVPAPDQLTLNRTMWLDFNGKGFTIKDSITGTKSADWRLEMNPSVIPGRVLVDGESQFITRMKGSERAGVEVRQGLINLAADSRMEQSISRFPAVGWNQSFQKLSAVLHLPPGWSLFDTSGIDSASDTWINQWSLLDLFVALIIALGFAKLWGKWWGVLALVALALLYHEPGAPRWIWLHLLAATALLRVLPANRFRKLVRLYAFLSILVLIIIAVPFMINQIREGMFPQLERPWQRVSSFPVPVPMGQAPMEDQAVQTAIPESDQMEQRVYEKIEGLTRLKKSVPMKKKMVEQYDPKATIQTGPGLPKWQWTTVYLGWNGPVEHDQEICLRLLSPTINMMLNFARVSLLAILTLLVLGKFDLLKFMRKPGTVATAMLIFFILLPLQNSMADMPSPEMLKQLQDALLQKPDCFPQCASSPRLLIEIRDNTLTARMEIHSEADTAVPLPGNEKHWLPAVVFLDGSPASLGLLRTDSGQLLLKVSKGLSGVVMQGPLPNRDTVQLALPLRPGYVSVQAEGWAVEGLYENGVAADSLQFNRLTQEDKKQALVQETANFAPFVQVERTLLLGLTWTVETRVIRMTPQGTAVVIEVPLLAGESVTTEGVRVKDNKALVNMGQEQTETFWQSQFKLQDTVTLTAPDTLSWAEVWRIDVSPVWHVDIKGIPVIHHQDKNGRWLPTWRPWPGESVTLAVSRPEGVPGQTVTIDSSAIIVTPGQRATEAELTLLIRSSQGGQKIITIPQDAALQSVYIDDREQPIRQEGRAVTLPLVPGTQTFKLLWRQKAGISASFHTPSTNLGSPSVNADIELRMPYDRWTLFTAGPQVGPAVLFWGVLIIIVILSLFLGRVKLTPLKGYHWLLLFIGLSQIPIHFAIFVVLWLLALGLRKKSPPPEGNRFVFDSIQLALAVLTLISLGSLVYAIQHGLLGHPDMQIRGNGSSSTLLRWYQDRADAALPQAWVFSVPLKAYRAAMLAWALWIASALLNWLRWSWTCFSEPSLWQPLWGREKKKV